MINNDYDIDWNKVNQMDEYLLIIKQKSLKLLELANELHESLYLD